MKNHTKKWFHEGSTKGLYEKSYKIEIPNDSNPFFV